MHVPVVRRLETQHLEWITFLRACVHRPTRCANRDVFCVKEMCCTEHSPSNANTNLNQYILEFRCTLSRSSNSQLRCKLARSALQGAGARAAEMFWFFSKPLSHCRRRCTRYKRKANASDGVQSSSVTSKCRFWPSSGERRSTNYVTRYRIQLSANNAHIQLSNFSSRE